MGAFAFQALALHNGQLSVVQPLLVTELVFALILRRVWLHQDVAGGAWTSALVVCVALAVFLTVAEPQGGHPNPDPAEWLSALATFGGVVVLLSLLATRGSPVRRAALFSAAAALSWAVMATFIKSTADTLAAFGFFGMFTHWPLYALAWRPLWVRCSNSRLCMSGPLSVSQPILVVIDPFASIILSVWLFDEHFTDSPSKIVVAAVAFAVMAGGVTMLSRTAPADLTPSRADG